jgi:hypothetical protein
MNDPFSALGDYAERLLQREFDPLNLDQRKRQQLVNLLREQHRREFLRRVSRQYAHPNEAETESWKAFRVAFEPHLERIIEVARKRAIAASQPAQPATSAPGAAVSLANQPSLPARHSEDFRSVHWYGKDYGFTPTQAACLKVLWRNWENGTPEVGEDTILTDPEVDAEAKRIIDVFRDRKSPTGYHSAWNTMIVPGSTKGAYRLLPT